MLLLLFAKHDAKTKAVAMDGGMMLANMDPSGALRIANALNYIDTVFLQYQQHVECKGVVCGSARRPFEARHQMKFNSSSAMCGVSNEAVGVRSSTPAVSALKDLKEKK